MDLNLPRRKREMAIAHELAQHYLRELSSIAEQGAPQELLVHHFALVCERLDFMPADEASVDRVLTYALKEVQQVHRKIDVIAANLQF